MGLKLVKTEGAVEKFIIDSIEMPTAEPAPESKIHNSTWRAKVRSIPQSNFQSTPQRLTRKVNLTQYDLVRRKPD